MAPRGLIIAALAILPSTPLAAQDARIGAFEYVVAKDPMDDTNRSYVFTTSVNATGSREAGLGWKCLSDGLNVMLLLGKFYGGDSDDRIRVRYRFDSEPPSDIENWSLFSGKKAAYLPMNQVAAFTERAKHATKVVIRTTDPLDGETNTDEFSLRGLTDALNRLGQCAK